MFTSSCKWGMMH